MGSPVSCGGSVAEPSVTGRVQHRAGCELPQKPPLQLPLYQNLTTSTQCSQEFSVSATGQGRM